MSDDKKNWTELWLRNLKPSKTLKEMSAGRPQPRKQALLWDGGCKGLSLLISSGGAKTFRCQFKLHGQWITHTLGRYGELTLVEARELTTAYQAKAFKGEDPRPAAIRTPDKYTYEHVVNQFIEGWAKPRQRTWDQTERVLKKAAPDWLARPFDEITSTEVEKLLQSFTTEGHPYKAAVTLAWMRKLWRWACKKKYVTNSIIEGVDIEVAKHPRTRHYTDDEVRSIWRAAERLDPASEAYFKLLVLLAPRKSALALLQWSHLNDAHDIWTTPHELTKSRKNRHREYKTPLPGLARRILKGLPKGSDRVFPTLPTAQQRNGQPMLKDGRLNEKLIKHGAPKDFYAHAIRHTIATFLENQGHSPWERGLVLNHTEQGVTAGYSHGNPLDVKLALLEKWADHVESLLAPAGVAVLR